MVHVQEYQAEGINVAAVVYNDNQDCIDLIEKIR
jgi:myosin heavy subunit